MEQVNKTLYGVATNGKAKQWQVFVDGDSVIVKHGYVGGKLQEKSYKAKPKNVGRANETTAEEQAVREAKAKWKKQHDAKLYRPTIAAATQCEHVHPMLAHDYTKQGHRIVFPCDVQPKLDGVRGLTRKDGGEVSCISREGNEYPLHDKLLEEIELLCDNFHGVKLDGELYCHGKPLQNIISDVRNKRDNIQYWIFDIAEDTHPWETRVLQLMLMKSYVDSQGFEFIRVVLPDLVMDERGMKKRFAEYIELGYEGIMLRNLRGMYKFSQRSPDLQKYKEFVDAEFDIVGVEVDKDGGGVLVCNSANGTFKCRMKGTDEYRKFIADNEGDFIGKRVTVKFQAYTEQGLPQFPVGVAIRDYE